MSDTGTKSNKVGTVFLIIYMVALVGSMYIFSQTKPILIVVSFGTLVLLIGVACMVGGKQEGFKIGNIIGSVLCTFAGSCMVAFPLLFLYAPSFADVDSKRVILAVSMISAMAIGISFWIALYSVTVHKIMRCTEKVLACAVDSELHMRHRQSNAAGDFSLKRTARSIIFSFIYYNQEYIVKDSFGSSMDKVSKGEKVWIRINSDNPEEFYRNRPYTYISLFVMGTIFFGVGLACMMVFVV